MLLRPGYGTTHDLYKKTTFCPPAEPYHKFHRYPLKLLIAEYSASAEQLQAFFRSFYQRLSAGIPMTVIVFKLKRLRRMKSSPT